ncbi:MAG: amidohydrolase [Defluviitaleaceae bacterium]|nr:amidohydrolase [Defluviitaleaceae bacterium]
MNIDMHSHCVPRVLLDYIKKHGEKIGKTYIEEGGKEYIGVVGSNWKEHFRKGVYDADEIISEMKQARLDKMALSLSMGMHSYAYKGEDSLEAIKLCNDWMADLAKSRPEHFYVMAALPMQDAPLALQELERAHEKLGFKAIVIGSMINDKMLDHEDFHPIYEYCAKKGILVYLHPFYAAPFAPYLQYYTINLVAFMTQTSLALTHLVFGGIFEKYPKLTVLASHGGGYFPYQFGRVKHVYKVRPEAKVVDIDSPEKYLKNIYFDTLTHGTPALQFLVDTYGADHVVLGTDYTFDMADMTPVDSVDTLRLTAAERDMICRKNAQMLMNL